MSFHSKKNSDAGDTAGAMNLSPGKLPTGLGPAVPLPPTLATRLLACLQYGFVRCCSGGCATGTCG